MSLMIGGRGPKVQELITFDDENNILSQVLTGHSYMGAKIDETYRVYQNQSIWENTQESGKRMVKPDQFYIAADGTPYTLELIVKAIDRTKNKKLELYRLAPQVTK
ncbi:hypothetical protein FLL45_07735 [Aliikangiella marina]|uniref:Uncharacterized protein n=1 Tax=Aliikangiella marina TaxID=1712262 RepID=A0A545TC96_9GAMM|nr:hypothetical protein [Aliikangiella marina]TQV74842.1 hypothetical protein FLL45_07735 [Aliikangiella marina]